MLNIYPDHPDGRFSLINIYAIIEEWEKATQSYERIRYFRGYGCPLMIQSRVYRFQGLYDKAKEVLEYLLNASEHPQYRHWLADTYLAQGKYDLALAEVDRALPFCQSTFPVFLYVNFLARGDIYLCHGEPQKAEDSYRKLLDMEIKPPRLYGFRGLASLYFLQGKSKKSGKALRQGIALANELDEKGWASDLNLRVAYLKLQSGNSREALQASKNQNSASQGHHSARK